MPDFGAVLRKALLREKTFIITASAAKMRSTISFSLGTSSASSSAVFYLFVSFLFFFLIKHAAIKFQLCLRDWKTIFHSGEHEKLFAKKKKVKPNIQENRSKFGVKNAMKICI